MAYSTIEEIVKPAIRDAFKLFATDAIPDNFFQLGVDFYNQSEPIVWRVFPWQTKKIEETVSPDDDGIITLGDDLDIVRAVQALDSDNNAGMLIWHEDEIRALINGEAPIADGTFDYMADDASGNRRIKVKVQDPASEYRILALRRFQKATVDPAYNAGDPSATPNDYRVLTWKIDQAESTLISFITDRLKGWNGAEETGGYVRHLRGTVNDLNEQQANTQTITPAQGAFEDTGTWS
jgi:hypothetical protein